MVLGSIWPILAFTVGGWRSRVRMDGGPFLHVWGHKKGFCGNFLTSPVRKVARAGEDSDKKKLVRVTHYGGVQKREKLIFGLFWPISANICMPNPCRISTFWGIKKYFVGFF